MAVVDGLDQRLVAKWLNDNYNVLERFGHRVGAALANKVPRRFRWLPAIAWTTRAALASSAPGLAVYYGTLQVGLAIGGAVFLFVGNALVELLGQLDRASSRKKSDHSMINRVGELLGTTKASVIKQDGAVDTAIGALLGIMEGCCRTATKSEEGEIAVTLLQYPSQSDGSQIIIRRRNPGNQRQTGVQVGTANLIGHAACLGAPDRTHVVHKLKHFGAPALKSPSQSAVNYQSIFIFPLQSGANGDRKLKGFVSIDCVRPYAFYGNRGREITVYCKQVANLLAELI